MFTLSKHHLIGILTLVIALTATGVWQATSPLRAQEKAQTEEAITQDRPLYEGNFVVVNLTTMKVELRNGTTTLETFEVVSKGKPGSYYETIGGAYLNDYKLKNHFSSLGHVYMPWSTHVFGNYFIHGIPYYESGEKVSNAYSGGCIRLVDTDAKKVYDFVQKGTPIIITEETEKDFIPTATSTNRIDSIEMTRFMVALISLEFLSQDDQPITDTDGITSTTRRAILPRLIRKGDDGVSKKYAEAYGEKTFVMYMNQKARALGLTNTLFTQVGTPAITSEQDLARFMKHVEVYKPYLTNLAATSSKPLSQ